MGCLSSMILSPEHKFSPPAPSIGSLISKSSEIYENFAKVEVFYQCFPQSPYHTHGDTQSEQAEDGEAENGESFVLIPACSLSIFWRRCTKKGGRGSRSKLFGMVYETFSVIVVERRVSVNALRSVFFFMHDYSYLGSFQQSFQQNSNKSTWDVAKPRFKGK